MEAAGPYSRGRRGEHGLVDRQDPRCGGTPAGTEKTSETAEATAAPMQKDTTQAQQRRSKPEAQPPVPTPDANLAILNHRIDAALSSALLPGLYGPKNPQDRAIPAARNHGSALQLAEGEWVFLDFQLLVQNLMHIHLWK